MIVLYILTVLALAIHLLRGGGGEGGAKVVKNAISGAKVVKKNKHLPCYMQHSDKNDFFCFVILLKYEKKNSFLAKYFQFKQNIPLYANFLPIY